MKILVPTDHSELSYEAFKAANDMAALFNGTVTPLYAYQPENSPGGGRGMPSLPEKKERNLEGELNTAAGQFIDSSRLESGILFAGIPYKAIINVAKNYDMVIMASHGRTGFTRMIMGSVAEKVIRFCNTPVMVIEDASLLMPLENIMVTTDYSENSARVFPLVSRIAQASKAHVHLVHIVSFEQFDTMSQVQAATDAKRKTMKDWEKQHFDGISDQVTSEVISSNRSIHEEITHMSEKNGYNLISMATIGRTGLDFLRMGSTASNVARHVKTPVLSINPRKTDQGQ